MELRKLRLVVIAIAGSMVMGSVGASAQQPPPSFTQGQELAQQTLDARLNQGGALGSEKFDHVIAEGDSWFSYPGLDVLDALRGGQTASKTRYAVYSAAKAGDTVESMAYDREQLEGFQDEFFKIRDAGRQSMVKAILLSGGGNDIAGQEFHTLLNHASSVLGSTKQELDKAMAGAFIERLARSMQSLIGTAQRYAEAILLRNDIPILIHGYAPPVPDGRPFGIGWPLPGPWLQPGFSAKGYVRNDADLARNTQVMAELITMFNARMVQLAKEVGPAANVRFVNVVSLLSNNVQKDAYKGDWSNEMHPRDAGFSRVAEAFHQRILK